MLLSAVMWYMCSHVFNFSDDIIIFNLEGASFYEGVPSGITVYPVFIRMPGESYRRRLMSLLSFE